MAEYTKKKTKASSLDTFTSIDDMWLYNFDRYRATQDNNWFRRDFTGRETKINSDLLKPVEEKINDEYYKATDDRSFQMMIQRFAKISFLQTKYVMVSGLVETMSYGFQPDIKSQENRAALIEQIKNWGFKMPIMATPYEDAVRLKEIIEQLQGVKTQIRIIENEMKQEGAKATTTLNKQILIVGMALQLAYKINPKETTISEWIEMCKLMEERAKKN